MEELIKNILYYFVLSIGSIIIICLLIAGSIRSICFMLDHMKIANVLRKALQLYIKQSKEDKKIKEADIKEE